MGRISSSRRPASIRESFNKSSVSRASRRACSRIISTKRLPVGFVVQRAAQKRFGKSLNRGQRRLEFVRDVGHKIAPHALQPAQLRDVMQHQDRAIRPGGAHRRGRDAEISAAHRAYLDLAG